ncbi:MAG: flagellar biosynthesis anti-sigma factor FlgM [Desulfobacterales bacterium]|nr:flagellar biosynthesis anti-sigma factor FlgM [Desulfobacterales bacterium]
MKISGTNTNYIQQAYGNASQAVANAGQQDKADTTSETRPTDSISLSEKTQDLRRVEQNMDNAPLERQKKVADLKERVQADQYTVDAQKVAEKMIGSIMDEMG